MSACIGTAKELTAKELICGETDYPHVLHAGLAGDQRVTWQKSSNIGCCGSNESYFAFEYTGAQPINPKLSTYTIHHPRYICASLCLALGFSAATGIAVAVIASFLDKDVSSNDASTAASAIVSAIMLAFISAIAALILACTCCALTRCRSLSLEKQEWRSAARGLNAEITERVDALHALGGHHEQRIIVLPPGSSHPLSEAQEPLLGYTPTGVHYA